MQIGSSTRVFRHFLQTPFPSFLLVNLFVPIVVTRTKILAIPPMHARRPPRSCLRVAFLGVNVLNPLTYVAVAIVECGIVVAASIAPALRAARVGPLAALREM